MNEKENPFSDDYLRKLQEQFSESKRKEEIRKKRAEGGKKGGRPIVNRIRNIQKNIELLDNNELEISYIKSLYNGCRDLDEHDDDFLVVNFLVNLKSGEVEIIGEPIPEERTTFEEF